MDRLLSMRAFVRVVDERSFAAAARALDAAPAAVTRLVADLEAHLGVRLLHRTTRRLALTEAGEEYLARARQILADIEEAEALATRSTVQPCGRVRVLVSPAFSYHQLAKHLPRFFARYPDVALDLASSGLLDMAHEAFDVSLLMTQGELEHGEFVAHRLATSLVVLAAAPAYLARHGTPRSPPDLANHASLVINSVSVPRTVTLHCDDPGGTCDGAEARTSEYLPRSVLAAEHADTLMAAAIAGVGIAGLPSFMLEDALAAGTLVRVLPGWHYTGLTLYAAMPTRKYVPARTRALVDFLIETFQSEGDPWLRATLPTQ
ncbi:LysR family transcriptional regulator [Piscinibacter koreensis]|uniref:LysR family transcriptional regulator n=1 Tax=Piscinibacter koreensis TaxID=2742824 RepID=A0A7Y6NMQ1_9BURK|nr:LysR family transcriptional regulator [Schlegelella koreensis]NUZ06038.1 LysR family transcriptional regulator [Schlegelella koreensis]